MARQGTETGSEKEDAFHSSGNINELPNKDEMRYPLTILFKLRPRCQCDLSPLVFYVTQVIGFCDLAIT